MVFDWFLFHHFSCCTRRTAWNFSKIRSAYVRVALFLRYVVTCHSRIFPVQTTASAWLMHLIWKNLKIGRGVNSRIFIYCLEIGDNDYSKQVLIVTSWQWFVVCISTMVQVLIYFKVDLFKVSWSILLMFNFSYMQ